MKKVLRITNPNVYAAYVNAPPLHPLVCILRYEELGLFRRSLNLYSVYGLFIQDEFVKGISYGMKTYETHGPSIIAVAPGQIGGVEDNGELISRKGWVLLWSPELMQETAWGKKMEEYGFFSYFSSNSLEMTPTEWDRISLLIGQMRKEVQDHEDSPKVSSDMLKRFHQLLLDYYAENKQLGLGVPSVQYCASELAYSPRYLGDMIHQTTGGTAIGYIHSFVVERGKSLLMHGHNVSETAHLLGFEYVHHFNRIFKKVTGLTPSEFLAK